jgi:hypothetical protein
MDEYADVTNVAVIDRYRLRLTFAEGTIGDVDFTAREWHGVMAPLCDPEYFAHVEVDPDGGTIRWPNGVDMAPEPLYAEAASTRRWRPPRAHSSDGTQNLFQNEGVTGCFRRHQPSPSSCGRSSNESSISAPARRSASSSLSAA